MRERIEKKREEMREREKRRKNKKEKHREEGLVWPRGLTRSTNLGM